MQTKKCKTCQLNKPVVEFHSTGFNTLKDGTRTKNYKPSCKECANVEWKRRFEDKMEAAGIIWKCTVCGYDKCRNALELHHLDPSQKDFAISSAWTLSVERMKKEIAKCVVLCANCHREVHAGVTEITGKLYGTAS